MTKISLHYDIEQNRDHNGPLISNDLIALLDAVRRLGSLSAAAKELGICYRHLWNELNAWEEKLGRTLLVRGRGKSGELSECAMRLLAAEKLVQAKYAQQISALRSGIEQAFAAALADGTGQALVISGCPDKALARLRDSALDAGLYIDLAFTSSGRGLEDLRAGKADVAGFNFPAGSGINSVAGQTFGPLIDPENTVVIAFADRIQGLGCAPGNPLGLHSLLDVASRKVRYLNRPEGTGTRVLYNELLKTSGLSPSDIAGHDVTVITHEEAAAKIAGGMADASIMLQCAAAEHGLFFTPLSKESYRLACRRELIESDAGRTLIRCLTEFGAAAGSMAGYSFTECGKVLSAEEIFL